MSENVRMSLAILLAILFAIYFIWFYVPEVKTSANTSDFSMEGELAIPWGDLGKKMVDSGVINGEKLEEIHSSRGEFGDAEREVLYMNSEKLVISEKNSGFALNLLWALGLGNKNRILTEGEMADPKYKGAGNFASTGGWTLSVGDSMNHYSMHEFIVLSEDEQRLVEEVSKNVFRPCCGNSTHFPDCNHGMAMLALLQIMAKEGRTETQMYDAALTINALWFQEHYANINKYFEMENLEKDARAMLSADYSSGQGYRKVLSKVKPEPSSGGVGCGV